MSARAGRRNCGKVDNIAYLFNNDFGEVYLDIKNFPEEMIEVTFEQVGDLYGHTPTHEAIKQGDGKYTHRFTFNSGSYTGEPTVGLNITINGQRIEKTLQQTGSARSGGWIYEG